MGIRLHVVGASGSGTTTLAAAVARELSLDHFDSDDYFWLSSDPPYSSKRLPAERDEALLRDSSGDGWVLSGSLVGWDARIPARFSHVIYLYVPPVPRMERIRARERERYGARVEPGGDMEASSREFLAWASRYDTAGMEQRSRVVHEAWLSTLSVPILRIEGERTVEDSVALARAFLGK